jgi:branched-chain amino acid transport system permease protein
VDFIYSFIPAKVLTQIFAGLSRTVILFIVSSGLSLILGVLRIPNVFHGSLYMIGAFMAFTITRLTGGGHTGFFLALVFAPLGVALLSLIIERGLFQFLYEREHLMLILFTFFVSLVFGDLVKMVWGEEFKSVPVPNMLKGFITLFGGMPFPLYNVFLLACGPIVGWGSGSLSIRPRSERYRGLRRLTGKWQGQWAST